MILSKITKIFFFLTFLLLGGCSNVPVYNYFINGDTTDVPTDAIPFSYKVTTLYSTSEFLFDTLTSPAAPPLEAIVIVLNADSPLEGSLVQVSELSGAKTGRILFHIVEDTQDSETQTFKGHYQLNLHDSTVSAWFEYQGKSYNAKLSFQKKLKIGGTVYTALTMIKGEPRITNLPPIANAGDNQLAVVGDTVTLNGSGTDPEGSPLTYLWTLTESPTDSSAVITNENNATAELFVSAPGTYTASLVVNDGELNSEPATSTIEVVSIKNGLTMVVIDLYTAINSLPSTSFSNSNLANAMTNKLNVIMKSIEKRHYKGAINKLKNDILSKTDGCSIDNDADKTDWVVDCESQKVLYDLLKRVETLMER